MEEIERLKCKISLVSPNDHITKLAREVAKEFGGVVTVHEGNLDNGVHAARQALNKGCDVLISRGGTANMIERALQIPVNSIILSGVDLIRTLEKAKQYDSRFGILGFDNMFAEMKEEYEFLDCILYVEKLKDYREIKEKIQYLNKTKKVKVFIGGDAVVQLAEEMGFVGILLECGVESIRRAFINAIRLAELKISESERYLQFKAITEHSSEGIIFIDEYGKIRYINPVAQNTFSKKSSVLLGLSMDDLLPKSGLTEAIKNNKSSFSAYESYEGTKLIVNYIPLNLNNMFFGGILSFQDVTKIEELEKKIRREQYTKGLVAKYTFVDIMTKSPRMEQLIRNARRISRFDSSVLITGESGTGKELVAQSIHNESLRKNGPFVAINCAALPESLLESELFGYVEGAFTGARKSGKPGLFELAHMGTIFLDEIGDVPLSVQNHLLRVIQEREVTRIGDDRVIPVNIRIIAATNKDLNGLMKQGKFRDDLFYRLDIVRIKIPPLRERMEDVQYLCEYFIDYYCKVNRFSKKRIQASGLELMRTYSWPGNIRELQNFVESLVILAEGEEITRETVESLLKDKLDYSYYVGAQTEFGPERLTEEKGLLQKLEYQSIKEVLQQVNGDKAKAAQLLGISTTTLWRRLKKLGL